MKICTFKVIKKPQVQVLFLSNLTNVLDKIDAAEINLMLSFKIQYGHSESEEF